MQPLASHIKPQSEQFQTNDRHNRALVAELQERLGQVREGGGPKYQQRHREQGKLFVRERINRLLDPGSPFLEIAPLAAWGLYDNQGPQRRHRNRYRARCWP